MRCFFILLFSLPFALADCPLGTTFESSFNKCYKLMYQPTYFVAAEQSCQGLGGHLVALENGFETSFVVGFVLRQDPGVKSFWIGANYLITSSWSWTYNVSFSYSNWAPGQPADPSINQCGAVRDSDNYWTKEICNSQKPFVCSINPNAAPVGSPTCPPPSTPSPVVPTSSGTCSGSCPPNYELSPVDCKCYSWNLGAYMTYNNSLAYCQSLGGSLSIITSAAQNEWLADWLVSLGLKSSYPWIGLTCPGTTKDSCFWSDGSPLTGYDNFDLESSGAHLKDYDGTNPNFFIRLDPSANDYGMWLRYYENGWLTVVCMQDRNL